MIETGLVMIDYSKYSQCESLDICKNILINALLNAVNSLHALIEGSGDLDTARWFAGDLRGIAEAVNVFKEDRNEYTEQTLTGLRRMFIDAATKINDDVTFVKYWQRKAQRADVFCNDIGAAYAKLTAPDTGGAE